MPVPRIRFQIQPTVAHYREPLVRCLQQSTAFVWEMVGRPKNTESRSTERIQSASEQTLGIVKPLETVSLGRLRWERGQVAAVWRGGFDAYVLEGRIYTVSTWVAATAGRIRGRTVLLWGHGWKRAEAGTKRRLRIAFYRLVAGLLVYGDRAKELATSYGVDPDKVHVVYNSLYSANELPNEPLNASAQQGSRPAEPSTLIYSSRLTARHTLDDLAAALTGWPDQMPAPRVIVVGEGTERERLEAVFASAGVEAHFLGAVYDFDRLRELYAQAHIALSIGGAGLNVIQALGFGVPVVAEADHPDSSPEIEAVIEAETGRYYRARSAASLRAVLLDLLGNRDELDRLGQAGLQLVRRRYSAERHAAAIEAGLTHFLHRG